jgi:hypothetical protein
VTETRHLGQIISRNLERLGFSSGPNISKVADLVSRLPGYDRFSRKRLWEVLRSKKPRAETVDAIARAVGVSVDDVTRSDQDTIDDLKYDGDQDGLPDPSDIDDLRLAVGRALKPLMVRPGILPVVRDWSAGDIRGVIAQLREIEVIVGKCAEWMSKINLEGWDDGRDDRQGPQGEQGYLGEPRD